MNESREDHDTPRCDNSKLLERMRFYVGQDAHDTVINKGIRGAMCGIMDEVMGDKFGRYALLYALFPGQWNRSADVTTKTLTGAHWFALWKWIRPHKDEDIPPNGKWVGHPALRNESNQLLGGHWFDHDPGLSTPEGVTQATLPGIPKPTAEEEIRDLGY